MTHCELSLGFDIGGTKIHGLVLDRDDSVLAEAVRPTRQGAASIQAIVTETAHALAAELGTDVSRFASVGVGIPGIVDQRTGLVETAVNLGISSTNLSDLFADGFTVPVRVENDVKATALGAGLVLGARVADLSYVNLGTGLATAAVSNGRLVRGARNGAGEIGHLAIDPAGDQCGCGQRGCIETIVGGRYLTPRLEALGLDLAGLGHATEPAAAAERDRLVGGLATALTLVVIAYDSAQVVLGGGIFRATDWLVPAVAEELRKRAGSSSFLAGLRCEDRLVVLPDGVPVAAIGAAVVGRKKGLRTTRPGRPDPLLMRSSS